MQRSSYTIIASLVLLALLSSLTAPTVVSHALTQSYCSGTVNFTFGQTTTNDFDKMTRYYNKTNGDSVSLFLKKGDATNNYKWTVYDNTFSNPIVLEAASTSGADWAFVNLFKRMLILKKVSTKQYFGFQFDPTFTTPSVGHKISIPQIAEPYTTFKVFQHNTFVTDLWFVIGVSNGVKSGVFQVQWKNPFTEISTLFVGKPPFDHDITDFIGSAMYIWDGTTTKFMTCKGADWSEDTSLSGVGKVITYHPFWSTGYSILSVMEPSLLTGKLFYLTWVGYNEVSKTEVTFTPSLTAVVDYSDDVQQFVRVTSQQSIWITLKNGATILTSNVPKAELDLTGILGIGLSGNKATIMYPTKFVYYQHMASGNLQTLFERTFTAAQMTIGATPQKWKVGLSCMCQAITKFECYSSTMTCLILTRGSSVCLQETNVAALA